MFGWYTSEQFESMVTKMISLLLSVMAVIMVFFSGSRSVSASWWPQSLLALSLLWRCSTHSLEPGYQDYAYLQKLVWYLAMPASGVWSS